MIEPNLEFPDFEDISLEQLKDVALDVSSWYVAKKLLLLDMPDGLYAHVEAMKDDIETHIVSEYGVTIDKVLELKDKMVSLLEIIKTLKNPLALFGV